MQEIIPTKHVTRLVEALRERGMEAETEYWDGHKHVDIYLPQAKMNIEIDGLQHYLQPEQIIADFKRAHYSGTNNIDTFHIPNDLLETHLDELADAITCVIEDRLVQNS